MDTLYILQDTITAHVVKVVDSCPCPIQATTTSNNDVMVLIICATIVVVVGIIAYVIYEWQKTKYCYQYKSNEQKYQYEIKKSKGDSADNTNKPNEDPIDNFLSFCEDRKDIRENKTFIDYCVSKYQTLKNKQLNSE